MAKVVGINADAKGFVRNIKFLVGKTRNDGERMLEFVLLKESEI